MLLFQACVAIAADVYHSDGRWVAIREEEGWTPVSRSQWVEASPGLWLGAPASDSQTVAFENGRDARDISLTGSLPLPQPLIALPAQRDVWKNCAVYSLSVRFDSLLQQSWALPVAGDISRAGFLPFTLSNGDAIPFELHVQDVVSGQTWTAEPKWQAQAGTLKDLNPTRFYMGVMDKEQLQWIVLLYPHDDGTVTLQGRVMLRNNRNERFLRVRMGLKLPPSLAPLPPPFELWPWPFAGARMTAGTSGVALFTDRAEPRIYRTLQDKDFIGFEYDLVATPDTANFPTSAAFSMDVRPLDFSDASTTALQAWAFMARQMPQPEQTTALNEAETIASFGAIPAYTIGLEALNNPVPFMDGADLLAYLDFRLSGLFPHRDLLASAYLCVARDRQGEPMVRLSGGKEFLEVNADPDMSVKTRMEVGQNRAVTLWTTLNRRTSQKGVLLRATPDFSGLDHRPDALYWADYPAVWANHGDPVAGIDLRHAEVECLAALSCKMREKQYPVIVAAAGAMSPFATYYADALYCESDDPHDMLAARILADTRPILWESRQNTPPATLDLARELRFWIYGAPHNDRPGTENLAETVDLGHILNQWIAPPAQQQP